FDSGKQSRPIDIQRLSHRRRSVSVHATRRTISGDNRFTNDIGRHRCHSSIRTAPGLPELPRDLLAAGVAGCESARNLALDRWTPVEGVNMAISRRRILQLTLAPAFLSRARAQVQDLVLTVSRIYPGADGKLVYVP